MAARRPSAIPAPSRNGIGEVVEAAPPPAPAELLAQEALDAEVYCDVFNADWTNLALGRSRNASDAQRLILAARDGGCIHCAAHTEATHAPPTPTADTGTSTPTTRGP